MPATATSSPPPPLTDPEIDRLALALVEEEYGEEGDPYTLDDITSMADLRRLADTLARRVLAFTAAVDGIAAGPDSGLRLARACCALAHYLDHLDYSGDLAGVDQLARALHRHQGGGRVGPYRHQRRRVRRAV